MKNIEKTKRDLFFVDMEGVLIPEIWPYISKETGISELKLTTRELKCYEELVEERIFHLRKNKIKIHQIINIISRLELLPGAKDL